MMFAPSARILFVSAVALGLGSIAQASSYAATEQTQVAWYEELRSQLALPSVSRGTLGSIRLYQLDRKGRATVIDLTVLSDNSEVRESVIEVRMVDGRYKQGPRSQRQLTRQQFEALKIAVLTALLPREELSMPSQVKAGEIWVCADGPMTVIELGLNYPTSLFVRREAGCSNPDPIIVAAKQLREFADQRGR